VSRQRVAPGACCARADCAAGHCALSRLCYRKEAPLRAWRWRTAVARTWTVVGAARRRLWARLPAWRSCCLSTRSRSRCCCSSGLLSLLQSLRVACGRYVPPQTRSAQAAAARATAEAAAAEAAAADEPTKAASVALAALGGARRGGGGWATTAATAAEAALLGGRAADEESIWGEPVARGEGRVAHTGGEACGGRRRRRRRHGAEQQRRGRGARAGGGAAGQRAARPAV